MELKWVTIRVKDLTASRAFYQDFLGLELQREFPAGPGMTIAFFNTASGTQIELLETKGAPVEPVQNVSIGLATSRYDEILDASRKRRILQGEPRLLGNDLECFFILDPDGLSIQVIRKYNPAEEPKGISDSIPSSS